MAGKAPDDEPTPIRLDAVGRQALADAKAQFSHDSRRLEDVALRYAHAIQREHAIRELWFASGCPVLTGGGDRDFRHPLVELMEKAEGHSQKLADALGLVPGAGKLRGPGRPQERFVPAAAGEPPRIAPLRSVG